MILIRTHLAWTRRVIVVLAGFDVLQLLALRLLAVGLQVGDGEELIDSFGGFLSPHVDELAVRESVLECTDHVVLLDERNGVLPLEEASDVGAKRFIFSLPDLIQHPLVARSLPRARVLAGESLAEPLPAVDGVVGEACKPVSALLHQHDRQIVCHYV